VKIPYFLPLQILSSIFGAVTMVRHYTQGRLRYTSLTASISDAEVQKGWTAFETKISTHISDLDKTVRHLNEITNFSAVNRERYQKNLSIRQGVLPEPEEPAAFPIQMLPFGQNPRFYGRKAELEKINQALDWKVQGNSPLRTYTIYGRRGVGKTQLALEYAYSNPANFEAIFWVACETGLVLRQSFTQIALRLNLPGADKHGMWRNK
jgi:hypothetical protein